VGVGGVGGGGAQKGARGGAEAQRGGWLFGLAVLALALVWGWNGGIGAVVGAGGWLLMGFGRGLKECGVGGGG
jgi:hypothetical protein